MEAMKAGSDAVWSGASNRIEFAADIDEPEVPADARSAFRRSRRKWATRTDEKLLAALNDE